jgi:hypothetical protein
MEPRDFRYVTLKELIERRNAKLRALEESGLTAGEAEEVLKKRLELFTEILQTTPQFVEPEDSKLIFTKTALAGYSIPMVGLASLTAALALRRVSVLPVKYRPPVQIAVFVTPCWLWSKYLTHESERTLLYVWDKYGDRAAARTTSSSN